MGTEAKSGRLARMRGAVSRTAQKLTSKFRRGKTAEKEKLVAQQPRTVQRAAGAKARPKRPQTDVPLDLIGSVYTPTQTSLKGPFRADGNDQQRDQEFAAGYSDERWNDEARF